MKLNPTPVGRIIMPFKKLRDGILASKGQEIYTSMLNNPYFVTPSPDMPTLLSVLDGYIAALATAQTRERTSIIIKNQNREILIAVLKSLATYIMYTSQGRLEEISTTGYDIAKTRTKSTAIGKPLSPSVTDGPNSGQLLSSSDGVKGVKNYVHQYRANLVTGDGAWESVFSSSKSCLLTGLVPGQKYTCRIGALGTNNQVTYSEPVTRIVQ